jgi:hypothetical protein
MTKHCFKQCFIACLVEANNRKAGVTDLEHRRQEEADRKHHHTIPKSVRMQHATAQICRFTLANLLALN